MARPRSNLKPQLEWSEHSGAFEPPEFSMLDAPDFPRAANAAVAAATARAAEPDRVKPLPASRMPSSGRALSAGREPPTMPLDVHAAGAPPTPPSLGSEPDSDLDDLQNVMVILPSDDNNADCGRTQAAPTRAAAFDSNEEVIIPSSSPSPPQPSRAPLQSPLRSPLQTRPLPQKPTHESSRQASWQPPRQPSQGPAREPSQEPPQEPSREPSRQLSRVDGGGFAGMIGSSPPAPKQSLPFRMEEAPASDLASQTPEIGSLLAEKIALLDQKLIAYERVLTIHKIKVDTEQIDARLHEVDRRINRFVEEDLAPAAPPPPPPTLGVPLGPGLPFDSDDDFDVVVDSVGPADRRAAPAAAGLESRYVDLLSSSDYDDSLHFSTEASRAFAAAADGEADAHDVSSDIVMETAPPPQLTPQSTQAPAKPWTKEMMYLLRTKFGLPGFRPNQLEAVNETLAGNDLVVLMPTGGGKSLCYQLPALCTSGATQGTTIVISPLISLMQDQVYHLKNRNIKAEMINSRLSAGERNEAFNRLNAGELQLLYISPEMLSASAAMRSSLQRLHAQRQLARIVIDEAHCVSSWGHDFRPDYKELDRVKSEYPGTPILALTATANERVLLDIVGCLRPNPIVLKQSFNRRNLVYEVRPKPAYVTNEIAAICRQFAGKTGIVYCFSKKSCEDTARDLRSMGISAAHYHAGMEQESRAQTQQDWQDGRCAVVCATIAFGMGIDKPDVRFVVHQTLPRNIEGYYQETGRAGRDGRISTCVLFYNYSDVQLVRRMIDGDTNLSYADKEHHKALLNRMLQYCENKTDCRRRQVLQYFNEDFDARHCAFMCDNCQNMRGQVVLNKDLTSEAKLLLQMTESAQDQQVTIQQCLDVVLGRSTKKVRDCGFDQLPTYGKLRTMAMTEVERLAHHLVTEHALEEYSVRAHSRYPQTYVRLGSSARAVLAGRQAVKLKTVSGPVPSAGPVGSAPAGSGSKRAAGTPTNARGAKRGRYGASSAGRAGRSSAGRRTYGRGASRGT